MMKTSSKIIKEIKKNIHPSAKKDMKSYRDFVKRYFPGGKAYGTRNPEVRKIAKIYLKEIGVDKKKILSVSNELWEDGYIESRIVASIFVGYIVTEPGVINVVKTWIPSCTNWVDTDILMGETKKYWIENPEKTLAYSRKLIRSKNSWERRFGLIILIWPIRRKTASKKEVMKIAEKLKDDKEKYVKKGYIWLMDQISKT